MLRRAWERLPEALRWCLPIWLTSRLALMGWGWLLWVMGIIERNPDLVYYYEIQPILEGWRAPLLGVWLRWDVVNYLRIANSGYYDLFLSAFFPLLPLLGRILNVIFRLDILVGMMLISNTALLPAMVLLYKISAKFTSSKTARLAMLLVVSFPFAFYYYAAYPHSLSLLLILGATWAAYKDRWWLVAVCGLLAGLAHAANLASIFILVPIAIHRWWPERSWRMAWPFLASITPLVGYLIFMGYRTTLGFPSFHETEYIIGRNVILMPWQIPAELVRLVQLPSFVGNGWPKLAVMMIGFGAVIYSFPGYLVFKKYPSRVDRLPLEIWLFLSASLMYMMLLSCEWEPFNSFPRRLLQIFPLYIIMAQWVNKPLIRVVFLSVLVGIQWYLVSLFLMWAWLD